MTCAGWDKRAKLFNCSLEPGGQSAWSSMQNLTSPKSHLFLTPDIGTQLKCLQNKVRVGVEDSLTLKP